MRQTCLNTVYDLAKKNKKIIFIGSDLGPGVLDQFKKEIAERFFMEGVSEQGIIGFAAGLAFNGYIPYVNTIATFITRRCFEQIAIDLCLHNLPVRLIGNGGGLVYAPLGPTHLALEDISIIRSLPNIAILTPCDSFEMEKLIKQTANRKGPIYIRLGRGGEKVISEKKDIKFGRAVIHQKPGKILIISCGTMTQLALDVSEKLKKINVKCGVLHINTIKPFDNVTLFKLLNKVKLIVTIEEHFISGGLASVVLETLNSFVTKKIEILRIGIEDKFPKNYGTQNTLQKKLGLDKDKIFNKIKNKLKFLKE